MALLGNRKKIAFRNQKGSVLLKGKFRSHQKFRQRNQEKHRSEIVFKEPKKF